MLQRVGEDERREFADFSGVETEIQQLMKGDYPTFMIKEIKEQPETIVNVSRGRVNYDESSVALGGLSKHIGEIKRSRSVFLDFTNVNFRNTISGELSFSAAERHTMPRSLLDS